MYVPRSEIVQQSPFMLAAVFRFTDSTEGARMNFYNLLQLDSSKLALRIMNFTAMCRMDDVGRRCRRYSVSSPRNGMDQKLATSESQQRAREKLEHGSEPVSDQLRVWLQATAKKDAQAFRQLYDAASPKLLGYAIRMLGKRELAEEVLQESFVNIWNNAATYQSSLAAPMTWMTTILRNKAFDVLRRTDHAVEMDADSFNDSGMQQIMDAIVSPEPTPSEAMQHSENASALAKCMSRLESLHRQAIAMAFFHDLSHSEVADKMQLPLGTTKTWIRRGLERLRLCLSAPGGAQ